MHGSSIDTFVTTTLASRLQKSSVKCISLNMCKSEPMANDLSDKAKIEKIIYWLSDVNDNAASAFSEAFYHYLCVKEKKNYLEFRKAFESAKKSLVRIPLREGRTLHHDIIGINSRLEYYGSDLLSDIINRSSSILDVSISSAAALEIAGRSRGTPRIANSLLRRVRDFAQIKGDGNIDTDITKYALEALNVDENGLDEMDNRILSAIIDKFKGGPVGLTTIATAVGEQAGTIEEVYEPFLIKEGYLMRTPRGRQATDLAFKHLGRVKQTNQGNLF